MSGRVRTRFSLQPSSEAPPKSAAVRFLCCSIVPIAPSSTRIRCARNSRKAFADSFRLRIRLRLPFLRVSRDKMLQLPRKSSVPATSIVPRFPGGYLRACSEVVLFWREWRFGGPEWRIPECYTGSCRRMRTLHEPTLENHEYRRGAPQPSENCAAHA